MDLLGVLAVVAVMLVPGVALGYILIRILGWREAR